MTFPHLHPCYTEEHLTLELDHIHFPQDSTNNIATNDNLTTTIIILLRRTKLKDMIQSAQLGMRVGTLPIRHILIILLRAMKAMRMRL